MNRDIRVLVTSISKKVPLLQMIRKALLFFGSKSLIFGADCDKNCIGQYFVDSFWPMPFLSELSKFDILDYCKRNEINVIIPTRDGELIFWSEIKSFLLENNIHVMVSDSESLTKCLDKKLFFEFLTQNQLNTPITTENISELNGNRFVVKERTGAGSRGIGLNLTKDEAIRHAENLKKPIFQPFIQGPEFTIDLFIQQDLKPKAAIARKRLLVQDGESQITETVLNKKLEDLCKNAATKLRLSGHVLFQAIEEKSNESYQIIECNPRFGGASTLSIKAGLDSFHWFFSEILGETLTEFKRTPNEIRLIRHAEDTFISL